MWKLKVYGLTNWGGWRLLEERTYKREELCRKRRNELRNFYFLDGWRTVAYYGRVA